MNDDLREQANKVNQDLIDERADRDRVAISAEQFYRNVIERVQTASGENEGEFQ